MGKEKVLVKYNCQGLDVPPGFNPKSSCNCYHCTPAISTIVKEETMEEFRGNGTIKKKCPIGSCTAIFKGEISYEDKLT